MRAQRQRTATEREPGDDRAPRLAALPALAPTGLRRRGLPSGRAAAGGLLVAMAALVAFAATTTGDGPEGRPVVVAARDLAPGTVLSPDDLEVQAMDLPAGLAGRTTGDPAVLGGAVTLAPLRAGDLVQASSVAAAAAAPAAYELALALPADRVVQDRLRPGDQVDVLATTGSGATARTDVVVRRAVVRQRAAAEGTFGPGDVAVTLGLERPEDVLAVAHALRAAEVTLVRATAAGPPDVALTSWPPPAATVAP